MALNSATEYGKDWNSCVDFFLKILQKVGLQRKCKRIYKVICIPVNKTQQRETHGVVELAYNGAKYTRRDNALPEDMKET